MNSDDDDDFIVYGTRIVAEEESRAGQRRKSVTDAAATKALPLHQQEVTDDQGRRRFHGAFTGGYSAGYYNTVGSKEGWAPTAFRSSRGERSTARAQTVADFYDEDELEAANVTALQTSHTYDTFGHEATAAAKAHAAAEAAARPSGIGALLPDDLLAPVTLSMGMQLLQKMGWRVGRGVAHEPSADLSGEAAGNTRWGGVVGVGPNNTPLYLLPPKQDLHGLGFDPFEGAEEFREARKRARQADAPEEKGKPKRRGVAFGAGVLDEDDTLGMMADYVDEEAAGRLTAKGTAAYHFEVASEEEDDAPALVISVQEGQTDSQRSTECTHSPTNDRRDALSRPGQSAQQYRLPGRQDAPKLLQSSQHFKKEGALIPGFVPSAVTVELPFFAPPKVPQDYDEKHIAQSRAGAFPQKQGLGPLPAKVDPPADLDLRRAIESLAVYVQRNGRLFEAAAAKTHASNPLYAFLRGGPGADYYKDRLAFFRAINKPMHKEGQRSAPLTVDDRAELLGEEQLPSTAEEAVEAITAEGAAPQSTAASRVPLMKIAEADRQRIQQSLGGNFVKAIDEEMGSVPVAGLRPGAPENPVPSAREALQAIMGARFTRAASQQTTQADQTSAAVIAQGGSGSTMAAVADAGSSQHADGGRRPQRRVEAWRPAPLLCKRLNVADPFKGKPMELELSKFKTDYLALPETAAAVAAAAAAAAEQQHAPALPPPPPRQLPDMPAADAPGSLPAPPGQPVGAAAMADHFLSSLMGQAEDQQQPAEAEDTTLTETTGEAVVERPLDIFKAIFEGTSSDEDDAPFSNTETVLEPDARAQSDGTVDVVPTVPAGVAQGPVAAAGQHSMLQDATIEEGAKPSSLQQKPVAHALAVHGVPQIPDEPAQNLDELPSQHKARERHPFDVGAVATVGGVERGGQNGIRGQHDPGQAVQSRNGAAEEQYTQEPIAPHLARQEGATEGPLQGPQGLLGTTTKEQRRQLMEALALLRKDKRKEKSRKWKRKKDKSTSKKKSSKEHKKHRRKHTNRGDSTAKAKKRKSSRAESNDPSGSEDDNTGSSSDDSD